MPKLNKLREFLSERMTAAVLEILGAVEETFADYQEEICRSKEEIGRLRRLLELVTQPEIKLHRLDLKQASDPEPPQSEEPQEEGGRKWEEQPELDSDSDTVDSKDASPTVNNDLSLSLHLYHTQTEGSSEGGYSLVIPMSVVKTEPDGEPCVSAGPPSDSLPFSVAAFSPEDESVPIETEPEPMPLSLQTTPPEKSQSFQGHTDFLSTSGRHGLFDPEPGPSSAHSSSITPVTALLSASPAKSWPTNFRVNWGKMPAVIQEAVATGQRPLPVDRRQMVRIVVDQMREHDLNPTRAICARVVQSIVQDYPRSFSDVQADGVGRNAYASLLSQIKTRVEHVNRHNNLARRRRGRPPGKCRGPEDQYGCVRWQPIDLPSGETEESLEDMRGQMLQLYLQEGTAGADMPELLKWLQTTYVLQRRYLNRIPAPPIADVKDRWPFLFSLSGLYSHFHLLTDIPIQVKLPEAIEGTGQKLFQFFRAMKTNPGVEEVLSAYEENESSDMVVCIVLLTMAHFREPDWGIFLLADPSATIANIEQSDPLPDTPRLIVQGDTLMNPTAWMLSIEGQVVMGPHTDMLHGMASLFASYYNFNLQYPLEAACTLEFIQRGFMGINPETGSKAIAGKMVSRKTGKIIVRKRNLINPRVCTLLRKLMDFEWLGMQPQLLEWNE